MTLGYFILSNFCWDECGQFICEINQFVFSAAAKEEEKQKLMKWSSELKLEREQLEQRVKQLSNSITVRNTVKLLSNTMRRAGSILGPVSG